jgi:hypothetical protein
MPLLVPATPSGGCGARPSVCCACASYRGCGLWVADFGRHVSPLGQLPLCLAPPPPIPPISYPLPSTNLPFPRPTHQFFNGEYYKQAGVKDLVKAHAAAFPDDPPKLPDGGYPDMGSGRFAALLPYGDWFLFNSAQRAHYNYLEFVASVLLFLLIGGLFFPDYATYAGIAWLVGREFYTAGYMAKGPRGRSTGAVIADIGLLALFLMAVYGPVTVLQGSA